MGELDRDNRDTASTLARLDERTIAIRNVLDTVTDNIRLIEAQIHNNNRDREEAAEKQLDHIDKTYVKKAEFFPIKILVYGFAGLLLTAVVSIMLTATIKSPIGGKPEQVQTYKDSK